MVKAPDLVDGEHERLENPPLSWQDHIKIILGSVFIFLVFTLVTMVLNQWPTGDKQGQTILWGAITGLEILVVLVIQSVFDLFFEDKKDSFSKQFVTRARQFGIKKPRDGKVIATDTLLILFCAIVPMDFLTYLVPGILQFIATSSVGVFFSGFTLEAFIVTGVVYNLITGIREEFVFRGYFLQRFKEKGTPQSAWFCSGLLFASLHVSLAAFPTFPAGPVLWFLTALAAGFLFGGYVLSTKRLLPVVLAHGIGNFISSASIWAYFTTSGFAGGTIHAFLFLYYGPMIAVGLVLAIAFRRRIKEAGTALVRIMSDLKHRTRARDWLLMIVVTLILWGLSNIINF